MIMKCLDYHDSHNTCSKDIIWVIKSSNSWSLLRSVNGALPDWNTLPMDIKKLPLNSFRMLLLNRFKFLRQFKFNFHFQYYLVLRCQTSLNLFPLIIILEF